LPFGTSFDDWGTTLEDDFVTKAGYWHKLNIAGPGYGFEESESAESQGWDEDVTEHGIVLQPFVGNGPHSTRCVVVWDSCDYEALTGLSYVDISRERRVWTDLYTSGGDALTGLVLNYRLSPYTGNPHFTMVGIDTDASRLLVGKFSGSGWSEVASSGTAALNSSTWYRIVTHVYGVNDQSTTLKIRVYEINQDLIHNWPDETLCTPVVSMDVTTNTFGRITLGSQSIYNYNGKAGLFSWIESGMHNSFADLGYFSQFNFDKQVE
jgi:hypothetical protein